MPGLSCYYCYIIDAADWTIVRHYTHMVFGHTWLYTAMPAKDHLIKPSLVEVSGPSCPAETVRKLRELVSYTVLLDVFNIDSVPYRVHICQ